MTVAGAAASCKTYPGALVRQLPISRPDASKFSPFCRYCGARISDAPGISDCQCDPPGSGYPRNPRDADYATRCAVCDSAVKTGVQVDFRGNPVWEHIWPSAERDHRAELSVTDEVRAAWQADAGL